MNVQLALFSSSKYKLLLCSVPLLRFTEQVDVEIHLYFLEMTIIVLRNEVSSVVRGLIFERNCVLRR